MTRPSRCTAFQGVHANIAVLQGTPQCFLLTPKLLPELPFSADCTVLSIVNGPLLSRLALPFNKASPAICMHLHASGVKVKSRHSCSSRASV